MRNIIVTGGTGVIGVALVRYLLEKGENVTAFVRPGSFRTRYLPKHPNLYIISVDMEDYKNVDPQLTSRKYDVFYHLAWDGSTGVRKVDNRNDMYLQNRNVTYALDAVELCHRLECPVFIATGSQAEYGYNTGLVSEKTRENPENGYGIAKLCAGRMTRILCEKYEIRHVWARLFSVYGPYDAGTQNLIYSSLNQLLKNERPQYTLARQKWDYLYSFDAAKALCLLSDKGGNGHVYNVAYGCKTPLSEYVRLIHKEVNPSIEPVFGEIPYNTNHIVNLCVDISKLKETIGFLPEVSFEEGIHLVHRWILEDAYNRTS